MRPKWALSDAAELTRADTVLEVGPGRGFLTEALLARAGHVIAVEKDARLVAQLTERFGADMTSGHLTILEADIRNVVIAHGPFRVAMRPSPVTGYRLPAPFYKLVANIPYYLTGSLLRQFLSADAKPSRMVLLVQREVAERIVAKDGRAKPGHSGRAARPFGKRPRESLLSISVKAYGTPRIVARVPAGAFSPPPKVDSAVLLIEDISRRFFDDIAKNVKHPMFNKNVEHSVFNILDNRAVVEERFFALVRAGFAHKRKLLASNLNPLVPDATRELSRAGINTRARAEDLSLGDWGRLSARVAGL